MFNNKFFKNLNESKYSAGIAMLMLNIGSKYISIGLSKSQESYLTSNLARQLLIFSAAFVATKDLLISLSLTLWIFFIFFLLFLIISDDELKNAIDVLTKARKANKLKSY